MKSFIQVIFELKNKSANKNRFGIVLDILIRVLHLITRKYTNRLVTYNFKGFKVMVPFRHHWSYDSINNPEWSMSLGRVASLVSSKYPNSVFFDIGANIGDTCAIIRGNGVKNKIYAIEGVPCFYETLSLNADILGNIYPINKFLSYDTSEKSVQLKVLDSGNGRVYLNPDLYGDDASESFTSEIETIKLSKLISNLSLSQPIKFLKTDIESMDMPVLKASLDVIKSHLPVIFFECHIANAHESEHNIAFLDFINEFRDLGYVKMFYWDCSNEYRYCFDLSDSEIMRDFDAIYRNRMGLKYADICLVHANDIEMAENLRAGERKYFVSQRQTSWGTKVASEY